MNKILVLVDKGCLIFSKYNREISEDNLNNTNVINIKNLKFTEEYVLENLELISTFFNLIAIKYNINSTAIKNLDVALTSLKIIEQLNCITNVNFIEDKKLTYAISSELLDNKNLEHIECYDLPDIMFYRFKDGIIKTRSVIPSKSRFFNYNNIKTSSDLHSKDKIVIDELLDSPDIEDILYFFSVNTSLRKVFLKKYSLMNIKLILNLIKEYNLSNVTIIIYEDSTTNSDIMNDLKKLDAFSKKYNVGIKIKYSKQYKLDNALKEFNLTFLKVILFVIVIIAILIFLCYNILKKHDLKNIEKNLSVINSMVDEKINKQNAVTTIDSTEEVEIPSEQTNTTQDTNNYYVSPYYREYSSVYDDLLGINEDTIGWLSVMNTKVNYPVVQASNNDYYLNHSYDKKSNLIGWIYADYRNNFDMLDQNTIIYGHSMVSGGLMFTTLTNTLEPSWYQSEENLIIKFSIKGTEYSWKVFSIYTVEATNDYLYTNFNTSDKYIEFLNMIKGRSIYDFNVLVDENDNILTLSTCYRSNGNRLVIHAKKI